MKTLNTLIFSMLVCSASAAAAQEPAALPDLTEALQARIDAHMSRSLQATIEMPTPRTIRDRYLTPDAARRYAARPAQNKVS